MTRPISTEVSTGIAGPLTLPGFLVEIDFASAIFRASPHSKPRSATRRIAQEARKCGGRYLPTSRGRKSAQRSICGPTRSEFMRVNR